MKKFLIRILSKLLNWLNKNKYTKLQLKLINDFKYRFRYLFGENEEQVSINDRPLEWFGITDLDFEFRDKVMYVTITLERPGMLIGKGGSTIDKAKKELSDWCGIEVRINIKESKLWRRMKY